MLHRKKRHVVFDAEEVPTTAPAPAPPAKGQSKKIVYGDDDDADYWSKPPAAQGKPHLTLGQPLVVPMGESVKKPKNKPTMKDHVSGDSGPTWGEIFGEGLIEQDDSSGLGNLESGEAGMTINEVAAKLMAQQNTSLDDSPWFLPTGKDMIFQLVHSLQNPKLDMRGDGFIINLAVGGYALIFEPVKPFPDIPRANRFPPGTLTHKARSVVDLTYWNVRPSWNSHKVRALTIPVCRVSGFRGMPIIGTKVKSVRRALATMGPVCPCHRPFHVTARGDDGRTLEGHDLVKMMEWGWQPGDPLPADPKDTTGPIPKLPGQPSVDPFADDS